MAGMVCYGLALAGMGLFVSSLCSTPSSRRFSGLLLHGAGGDPLRLCLPIENMPQLFQWLAAVDPLSHFILLLKGLPQGSRLVGGLAPALALLAIAGVTLSLALAMFRAAISPDDSALPGSASCPPCWHSTGAVPGTETVNWYTHFMHGFEFPRITPEGDI